jgi:uncharacterized protein with GYD domain
VEFSAQPITTTNRIDLEICFSTLSPSQGEVYFVQSCPGTGAPNIRWGKWAASMLSASAISQTDIFFRSSPLAISNHTIAFATRDPMTWGEPGELFGTRGRRLQDNHTEDYMPTFILSLNWTDQGIRSVKDAPKRARVAQELAKKVGVEIKEVYLTSGDDDLLLILDTPSGDNVAKFALAIGSQGNVRTRTVRAWPQSEFQKLISELP